MASEESSSSASASASSSSPAACWSSSAGDSYIGSLISLTSRCDIRYEGFLASINPHESTIAMRNVRSYGTEGRKKDAPQIPPSDKVYEYILFGRSDIKDLQVKAWSPVHTKQQVHHDPAIIQSRYAHAPTGYPCPVSAGSGSLTSPSSHDGLAFPVSCTNPLLSHPASTLPSHLPTMTSISSYNQEFNVMNLISGKAGPTATPMLPILSLPYSSSSIMKYTSGPLMTVPLLAPDQLTKYVPSESSSLQKLYPKQNDMGALLSSSSNPWASGSALIQAPLLPLPLPSQQPVYNKDDFFDTLSCNSLNFGGGTNFSEHMRLDPETFGDFHHRPPIGRGNYGPAYAGPENFRDSYNRGRGYGYYGYGGRGHRGYRPI